MPDVGTFRISILIESPLRRGETVVVPDALVDCGAEFSAAPRAVLERLGITPEKQLWFRTADGRSISRDVGFAIVHAAGTYTTDEVVFAEPGDLSLLGARSLEGMNLLVDAQNKRLVPGGPIDAAAASDWWSGCRAADQFRGGLRVCGAAAAGH